MVITLEELAKEVQKLKDIEEIKVLKARYSDMCDSNHDWTQIKDLFAPDAKWIGDPTQPWGGGNNREEIEKLFQFYQKTATSTPTASGSSASFHSGIRFALLLRTAGTIKSFSGNCRGLGFTAAQYIKQTQETE